MYNITLLNDDDGLISDFIEQDLVTKMKMAEYTFLADSFLLKRLATINFPIKNKRLASIRVLEFLTFLDKELYINDMNSLIQIPLKTFYTYFPKDHILRYKKILEDLDIITCVPYPDGSFYKYLPENTGSKKIQTTCMQFRIHNAYLKPKHLGMVIFDPSRKQKTEPKVLNHVIGLNEKYIKTIELLRIDLPLAIKAEFEYFKKNHKNLFKLKARIAIILRTERDRIICTGDKVDRIYHTFSNVSRISRKFFNIKFNNADVKNCQPLLLVSYLFKNQMPFDQVYKQDCEASLFYSRFVGINGLDKDAVKVQLYKSVFFGFDQRTKFNKSFKQLYPLTWKSLADLKNQKVSLAAQLQNLESALFNILVPTKSEFYFTLFDAIYYTDPDDTKEIIKQIEVFFMNLGVSVQIRINDEEVVKIS